MATSSIFFSDLTNPTKIGSIEVDILVEQEYSLESDVTEHPVEDGFPVADHVIRKPVKVSMVVGITQSPVTWLDRLGQSTDKVSNALTAFEQIYKNAQPITIITPSNAWENMVMTSARFPRTAENKNLIRIPCEFTQIRRVKVKTTDIPQNIVDLSMINRAGETEANGGTATQEEINNAPDDSGRRASMSKRALEGISKAFGG
jgi:hypothetical protein